MAGIGFELKKLFHKKGIINTTKAYGYATVICAGPMLLGVLLLLGIMAVCSWFETATATRELLICMITYTLLASVTVSSFFSMVVTRYVADMLFEDTNTAVLPAFWGSTVIMLAVGSPLYGIFLLFSGATLAQGILCFMLFGEL
ncbi:MAG: exopolysaccharide Pel transporter PelG, partial [Clostridia bacterium]|nr:exopolysaccharide Pel transporter PelG [Clostridia bacterium]